MNQEQSAAVAIRKFLIVIKGLAELEPALTELGSIKQAADETSSRVTKLLAEEAQQKVALATAKGEVNLAKVKAKEIIDNANTEASQIIGEATGRAAEVQAEAKRQVKSSETQSQEILLTLRRDIKTAEDKLKLLVAEATEAERRYSAAQQKLNEVIKLARAG